MENGRVYRRMCDQMTSSIWYWTKGNVTFYTRKDDIAKTGQRQGFDVKRLRRKSNVYRGRII